MVAPCGRNPSGETGSIQAVDMNDDAALVPLESDEVRLFISDGLLAVTGAGSDAIVERYVERPEENRIAMGGVAGAAATAMGLASSAAADGTKVYRLTEAAQKAMDLHGSVPAEGGRAIRGWVTDQKSKKFAKQLSFEQVPLSPDQLMNAQMGAVGLAIQVALADIQKSIEELDAKVEEILDRQIAKQVGEIAGLHRATTGLAQRLADGKALTETDWQSVASAGVAIRQSIDELRHYIHRRLSNDGDRQERLEAISDLEPTLWLLSQASQALLSWELVRVERVRLHEPEHLGEAIEHARAELTAQHEGDEKIITQLAAAIEEAVDVSALHGLNIIGMRRMAKRADEAEHALQVFASSRRSQQLELEERDLPSLREGFDAVRDHAESFSSTGARSMKRAKDSALDAGKGAWGRISRWRDDDETPAIGSGEDAAQEEDE